MSKFVYNRATTRICAKPFIENSHYAQKKVNKRPYWLVKNTPHLLFWFQREHVIQLTDNCEWKAQNLWEKWRKSKPDELVSLKNVLKVRDPKLSRVLNIQNDVHASEKFAKRATCEFFSAFFFVACWIRTQKVNADRKIEQFFTGFFHISKRRETALQLNRTKTLKPSKQNAHVILFTHGRA